MAGVARAGSTAGLTVKDLTSFGRFAVGFADPLTVSLAGQLLAGTGRRQAALQARAFGPPLSQRVRPGPGLSAHP